MVKAGVVAPFREVVSDESGEQRLILHLHSGQTRAWESKARFVMIICGTQWGKTSFGPHWLQREIQERGSGDYLAITATYPLLKLKMQPEFLYVFDTLQGLG